MKRTGSRISSNKFKFIIKTIGKILSVLSIVFIAVKIYKLGFNPEVVENIPGFIAVSVVAVLLKMLSVVTSASGWRRWISFLSGKKICFWNAFYIYGKAGIGKYLPGNVMHYVERNLFAAEYGLPQKKIALGSILETLELVASALLMSVILLPESFKLRVLELLYDRKSFPIVLAVIAFVVSAAILIFGFAKWQFVKKLFSGYKANKLLITIILTLVEYTLTLLLLGSGMILLWWHCVGNRPDIESLKLMISSYSTAWVCGFVIPGASGGIGIREAILSVLLDGLASGQVIMFIIIAHRLITIIGDFAIYALVSVVNVTKSNRKTSSEED